MTVRLLKWHEEPINKNHDRQGFDCSDEALNDFLRLYARKSHDAGGAKTFLAIDDKDSKRVLGFYSVSPASIEYKRTPEIVRRSLATHDIPCFRLARLGGQLLMAVGRRCLLAAAEVGGIAIDGSRSIESIAKIR
jgi:hypothetical protein